MDEPKVIASIRPAETSLRELQAAQEIAHAFLTSQSPADVYRLALERVAPLVGAEFGCVYLRDRENADVLRLVASCNWPADYAPYLDRMRVRIGAGPTGRAVADAEMVEVFDVFADDALEDWREAAAELGFASVVSLPLAPDGRPVGAVTFYFEEPGRLDEFDRSLLRLVAEQLSATAEKAHLIEDLRHANERLREQNVELEARYREAEEARRLKNEFLANVSHELRTPLTAILGYTYLLREDPDCGLADEQRGPLDRIEAAGSALLELIDDLLGFTNLKLGRTEVEPERCDAVALARAAASDLSGPAEGVAFRIEAPRAEVPVRTDPSQVMRILRKLLSNAFKFTSEGRVVVRVASVGAGAGRRVAWEVEDTGIGIAPEHQEAIFDEFRQLDGSPTRRYGGTGLGLAFSRLLARRLGGEITLRSTPGRGSLFRLSLPAPEPADGEDDAGEAGPDAPGTNGDGR